MTATVTNSTLTENMKNKMKNEVSLGKVCLPLLENYYIILVSVSLTDSLIQIGKEKNRGGNISPGPEMYDLTVVPP